jgi:hypothetical protein
VIDYSQSEVIGMVAIRDHFDGKVIVPDEPLDLPPNQRLIVHLEPVASAAPELSGVPGQALLRFAGSLGPEEAWQISAAIDEGCERIDANEW